MSQIYLFSGENLFEIDQEKRRWIAGFTQKHGEENITHIDGKKLKTGILMDEIAASPFIAEKRLIVLLGIPKMEKGEMLELQNVLHPQNLLLIVDPKPDKRLSSTKELLTIADVKQFAPLRNERLTTWISAQAQLFGSSISRESAQHLVATVGEDQMLLASEMRKLATFAGQKQITNNDIDETIIKKGHLKEILLKEGRSYFDTNTTSHHHFYDEETQELIDCGEDDIDSINLKKNIPGKKIKSVEVLIKVASDNQNQN